MKFFLIGSFAFKTMATGGQPVKSRELYWALSGKYGAESLKYIETAKWKRHPFSTFFKTILFSIKSDVIIMLPAHNGVKVFSGILVFVKKLFRKKIYYDVIGGWLNELLDDNPRLEKRLRRFDGVFVETETMKAGLDKRGIPCRVIPNFKSLEPVAFDQGTDRNQPPFKLCFFSRITEMKGIEEAIEAICFVNKIAYTYDLDIYGPVDGNYKERFFRLVEDSPSFITYKGCVPPDDSVSVLKDYFALLFPTKFYTEGVPGTIIDAYFSGIPVISSRWLNFSDVIEEGKTGLGFDFNDFEGLKKLLIKVSEQPSLILNMRANCLNEAKKYTPEHAMDLLNEEYGKEEAVV